MTLKYDSAFSPRDALEFCSNIRPLPTEGAVLPREESRECRTLDAPAASRVEKNTRVSHHGHAGTPGIPRAMVLTVSFALSRVTGLVCHPRRRNRFHQLDASVGASGPHDFAVRKPSAFVNAQLASTASCPASVTISSRPSVGQDGGKQAGDLRQKGTEIFLQRGLDMQITFFLILRSALFARVSKDGNEGARSHPSRRGQAAAPQDEGGA
jgi:hypothetical protein